MTAALFAAQEEGETWREVLDDGVVVLRRMALADDVAILAAVRAIADAAPFRHMVTPGGFRMSVAMTNCGALGWVSDLTGYRYSASDPETGVPWPPMPEVFSSLAQRAAAEAGFDDFVPDACLVNRYVPGARMSLHQDRNERDRSQPIVSVSLGLPVTFQFGGLRRQDRPMRIALTHGDVIVWGGPARLRYHGVLALKAGDHPALGACRINLTFRKAG